MIETKSRKELAPTKNILRALRLDNIFGKPSDLEDAQLNLQDDRESLNPCAWIEHKNASLDAERTKALMAQQRQRFI